MRAKRRGNRAVEFKCVRVDVKLNLFLAAFERGAGRIYARSNGHKESRAVSHKRPAHSVRAFNRSASNALKSCPIYFFNCCTYCLRNFATLGATTNEQ